MIVVKLQGGLGNQMFQYALARHLSIKNETELVLDLSFLNQKNNAGYTKRDYEMGIFNISGRLIDKDTFSGPGIMARLVRKLKKIQYVSEPSHSFIPEILNLGGNVVLNGFWQSEKYFEPVRAVLVKDFSFKNAFNNENLRVAEAIQTCNAVSLHVRRGDYVGTDLTPTYHNLCSLDYYRKAIELINYKVRNPVFFIFSDDIEWVKKNLPVCFGHHFIAHNYGGNNSLDMRLMSLCKHNIIANSSFSWWAAWLNTNPGKIIIAPKKWFNNPGIDTSDIIPTSWIRI